MTRGLTAVCAALLALAPAFAQDEQGVSQPAVRAFFFAVKLKVVDKDANVSDTRDASMVTFSGKPIGIKLDGKAIKGIVAFTVYAVKDKPLLLLAQGQLLVVDDKNKDGNYVTVLKYIPFVLGEKIEFYPLGKGAFFAGNNILFEVKIDEYQGDPEKIKTPPLPRPEFSSPPPKGGAAP
jgi:hypothetical protein